MPRPLVIAYHLTWTVYGAWLPNDPRGSMSHEIISGAVGELGSIHYGRRKVQPPGCEVREFYERAEGALNFPLLKLTTTDFATVAEGLAEAITQHRYTCYACAIMPDHVHILIRKHKHQAEQMIETLQESSRLRLSQSGARETDHPTWAENGWRGFLDHPDAIRRTIRYIDENPVKWKLPRQSWPFVIEYDGWPLHPGHNPNSPYAKRLRDYRRG